MSKISNNLYNVNVASEKVIITPEELKKKLPMTELAGKNVLQARSVVDDILNARDPRLMVVVGPCSIHDMDAAYEYAKKLKELAVEVEDCLYLIMRVYFEKPRTTVGWKGLINDPGMDDSFDINKGLQYGRKLLLDLAEMNLPTATEALNAIVPQYVQDLICWTAIGARTTESQTHREMSSGLSTAVGFKNGTDGNLTVAINALQSALSPHSFLGINNEGQVAVLKTKGNDKAHIVLRGGGGKTNFDSVSVAHCESELKKNKLKLNIMIDVSHANSGKKHEHQPLVIQDVINQVHKGNQSIIGLMVESNLEEGNQSILPDKNKMKYGVSVTDACIDWKTTEDILRESAAKLRETLPQRESRKL
ncbi:MAG: 3-deoxy-7-phosphoheptulonate synthase [Candidatus Portiera sp.]|nr:3-deoxy-7-phosphoheptulonate synthase [Portiera sp.]